MEKDQTAFVLHTPNLDQFVNPKISGGLFNEGMRLVSAPHDPTYAPGEVTLFLCHSPYVRGYDIRHTLSLPLGLPGLELERISWFPMASHGNFWDALIALEAKLDRLIKEPEAMERWTEQISKLWWLFERRQSTQELFDDRFKKDRRDMFVNLENTNDEEWVKPEHR